MLLNRYKYGYGLENIVVKVDNHTGELASVFGTEIVEIYPLGLYMGDDVEIPYHRVKEIYDGNSLIYRKS
jgi:uncharacterized protein (UPF0248 family)